MSGDCVVVVASVEEVDTAGALVDVEEPPDESHATPTREMTVATATTETDTERREVFSTPGRVPPRPDKRGFKAHG